MVASTATVIGPETIAARLHVARGQLLLVAETHATDSDRTTEPDPLRGLRRARVGIGAAALATAGLLGLPTIATASPTSTGRIELTDTTNGASRLRLSNDGYTDLERFDVLENSALGSSRHDEVDASPIKPLLHRDAARDLISWLRLSDSDLADLVGVSRRTVINWRGGEGSYGSTTRRLFATHALVSQLIAVEGLERSRLWLNGIGNGSSHSRLDLIRSGQQGLSRVVQEAEPVLFNTAPSGGVHATGTLYQLSEEVASDVLADGPRNLAAFDAAPRRPRRAR